MSSEPLAELLLSKLNGASVPRCPRCRHAESVADFDYAMKLCSYCLSWYPIWEARPAGTLLDGQRTYEWVRVNRV